MKTREYTELKKKDSAELQKLVDEKRTEIMGLRFSLATGALEDPSRLGAAKRDVARLLTLLGDKRRAEAATAKTRQHEQATRPQTEVTA